MAESILTTYRGNLGKSVASAWAANGLMQGTIANVQSWQASSAAATASAGVAPMSAQ